MESLEKITAEEFLNPDEMEILSKGRDFMWQVRYALHMITDREEDRLLFDHQRELAALWGFEDGKIRWQWSSSCRPTTAGHWPWAS